MIALGAALFMLFLFLPVFAYAILVGNRADYNLYGTIHFVPDYDLEMTWTTWDYEEITDNPLKEHLRDIYWKDGGAYPKFVTWSQGIWIFILLGVILEAVFSAAQALPTRRKKRTETEEAANQEELCIHTVQMTAFIGIFFFAMLFEGRARYLLPNIPL